MYKLGGGNRQQLMHSMITDPFTDEQLDWTLTEISKVRTKNSFISPNSAIKPSAYTQLTWEGRNVKKHTPLRTLIIGNNWNRFANFMKYFSFFLLFSLLCTPLLTLHRINRE